MNTTTSTRIRVYLAGEDLVVGDRLPYLGGDFVIDRFEPTTSVLEVGPCRIAYDVDGRGMVVFDEFVTAVHLDPADDRLQPPTDPAPEPGSDDEPAAARRRGGRSTAMCGLTAGVVLAALVVTVVAFLFPAEAASRTAGPLQVDAPTVSSPQEAADRFATYVAGSGLSQHLPDETEAFEQAAQVCAALERGVSVTDVVTALGDQYDWPAGPGAQFVGAAAAYCFAGVTGGDQ